MSHTHPLNIVHRPEQGRFEVIVDGARCECDYRLVGNIMQITHTGVPRVLEGRGLAATLLKHALHWAREQGHQVDPVCSYVQVYMKRHPEWRDLLV
jgi:predicted GNAT family acetyltransferase